MPGTPAPRRGEGALERIAGFAAHLRDNGLALGIGGQQAMIHAALALPPQRCQALAAAWRAIACHDPRDWRRWPDLFERYWQPQRARGATRVSGQTRPARHLQQLVQDLHARMAAEQAPPGADAGAGDVALQPAFVAAEDPGQARAQGGASRVDPLHERALAQWLPQDLALLEHLVARIARALRRRLTRRWRDAAHGRRLDVRRTLRRSLRTGGLPLAPAWREPRRERPRLFVLVDVSRSMETHAQLFLRIARAFVGAVDARVFVFHTRLAEVTPLLRGDSATVQEKINAVTAGFGGGTRIATSLGDFRRVHARAQLGRRARVWVLSDGFDADPPAHLAAELAQLRRRGARVAWLYPGRRPPSSRAMAGAADAIDELHRLDSLADLERLSGLLR
jgi:uncharacterized protein with von Willebrand factor type A (vWA) domain